MIKDYLYNNFEKDENSNVTVGTIVKKVKKVLFVPILVTLAWIIGIVLTLSNIPEFSIVQFIVSPFLSGIVIVILLLTVFSIIYYIMKRISMIKIVKKPIIKNQDKNEK